MPSLDFNTRPANGSIDGSMRGLIIAAGRGSRLGKITDNSPKCLLKVGGVPIVERIINEMFDVGAEKIALIRGYMGHKFELKNLQYFENIQYSQNNILHSMMCAKDFLVDSIMQKENLIISYSDIVFDSELMMKIAESEGSISLLCDPDWEVKYLGRTQHPKTEAEIVITDNENLVLQIGKLFSEKEIGCLDSTLELVEFTGLIFLKPDGIASVLDAFEEISSLVNLDEPFGRSKTFQNAYLSDLFQFLVDSGQRVEVTRCTGTWFEIDTEQDLLRADKFFTESNLI
jgi:choline kinase